MIYKLGTVPVKFEHDIVRARNLGSLLAQEIEFDKTTCIRIGTTVSELSRNMLEHADGGIIDFCIVFRKDDSPGLSMTFKDKGSGIDNLEDIQNGTFKSDRGMGVGLSGSQRLMDDFNVEKNTGKGTAITATKWLPGVHKGLSEERLNSISKAFKKTIELGESSMVDTINAQNRELQFLLRKLQERNEEIETINYELEETNKGVVALNRELEDRTIAIEKAKREAEEANKAKSEFLANMSHEIRTPMNAILGFTEILENKISDNILKTYLSSISSSGKALLNIINDILDLSKIEAGKMELHYHAVNLFSILNEVGQIFKYKTHEKKIDFILDFDSSIPKTVIIDDVRLRQILFNLVGNAVKFTDRGFVKLSVKLDFFDKQKSTVDLRFLIEDSGVGIPKDQTNQIFEAFKQQINQDLNKYGGTGLGLTITSRLIKMMEGNIQVKSQVGKGSTFIVLLHNIKTISPEKISIINKEKNQYKTVFEKANILVVDDFSNNRILIRTFLKKHELNVHEAADGEEALQNISQSKPDLILMDLKMPKMDGYKANAILKSDENYHSIPVIAFTASVMKEEIKKISNAGFDDYLKKPFSGKELISVLKKFLKYREVPVKKQTSVKKTETGKNMNQEQLSQLLVLLNGEFRTNWEIIRKTFILGEIIAFAKDIKELGENYGANPLIKWGDNLFNQAQSFDMERLPSTLNQFVEVVESLSKNK